MTTYAQYIQNGIFTKQAEMACDFFSHTRLDGGLSDIEHRKMLHAKKGTKTQKVLQVFGPLYPTRKVVAA